MAKLIYSDKEGAKEIELQSNRGSYVIGRAGGCDVPLAVNGVSRKHAELRFDAASRAWTITDLGSSNGTWINGTRVSAAAVSHGDELLVGECRLSFDDARVLLRPSAPPPLPSPTGSAPRSATREAQAAAAGAASLPPALSAQKTAVTAAADPSAALRQQIATLQRELDAARTDADRLQSSAVAVETLKTRLREATAEAEQQRMLADQQRAIAEDAQLTRLARETQISELQSAVQSLRALNTQQAAVGRRSTPSDSLDFVRTPSIRMDSVEMDALKRRIVELTHAQDSLRAERDELLEQVSELQVDRGRMQVRMYENESQVDASASHAAVNVQQNEMIAALQTQLNALAIERDELVAQVRSLRATVDAMPDPRLLVTINDRLARAELELQRRPSQAEVDELRQRLVSHEEALDSARLRIANLTQVLRNVADAARASQSRDQQVASELDGIRELASRLTATADKVRVQDWGWRELLEQVTALTNSPRTGANESVDR
jgi:uncharacterized coiled-coil DUF342 family protein